MPFALKLLKQDSGLQTRRYLETCVYGIVGNLSLLQCVRDLVLGTCFLLACAPILILQHFLPHLVGLVHEVFSPRRKMCCKLATLGQELRQICYFICLLLNMSAKSIN